MAKKRVTRHNGRAGKNGVYKADHNDRSFHTENADHIDDRRVAQNIYWDCYHGVTYGSRKLDENGEDITFQDVERAFYAERFDDYLFAQHERNAKTRHLERDRSVDDLLNDKRFCPEETIYQIGTMEDSVSPDELLAIVGEFILEMDRRFGEHVHVIDWALHLDEATPHIHERHVFDCKNRYGEIQPAQEKALEALGFELPHPEKKVSRYNNRKTVFDATCRTIMFDICKKHGIDIEEEPETGGRAYLEKQDFILMKQKEKLAEQEATLAVKEQELETVTLRLDDAEKLIDEVSEIAYDKAVEVVTDVVRAETQLRDEQTVSDFKNWCLSPERNYSPAQKNLIGKVLGRAQELIHKTAQKVLAKVQTILKKPKVRTAATKQIKEMARSSVLADIEKYRRANERMDAEKARQKEASEKKHDTER